MSAGFPGGKAAREEVGRGAKREVSLRDGDSTRSISRLASVPGDGGGGAERERTRELEYVVAHDRFDGTSIVQHRGLLRERSGGIA